MLISATVFTVLLAVNFTLWYIWRRRRMSYFARIGIPGPKPNFFLGNLKEIGEKGTFQCHKEWIKKYGNICGFYFGGEPVLLVSDPDLLKLVEVKEFQSFLGRKNLFPGSFFPNHVVFESTPLIHGPRWKRTRSIISPIFNASRMKWMMDIVDAAGVQTCELMKKKAEDEEPFDMYKTIQGCVFDIITKSVFGVSTTAQVNRDDPFLQDILEATSYQVKGPFMVFTACFPELSPLTSKIRYLTDLFKFYTKRPSTKGMLRNCENIMDIRKAEGKQSRPKDILSLMLHEKATLSQMYGKERESSSEGKNDAISMSWDEILGNAGVFLIAGYENISLQLAFTFRFLVHHQDIQDKAREEARRVLESEGAFDYNSAAKLAYIEQVMNESMRLLPVVNNFIFREANEDFRYKDIFIPKGTVIQASLEELHRSPDYWEDPLTFNPDRFSPENKDNINPYAFQPFGQGPRQCIGIRYSQLALKLAIARFLVSYKYLPCDRTHAEDGGIDYKMFQFFPVDGVYLKAVPCDK